MSEQLGSGHRESKERGLFLIAAEGSHFVFFDCLRLTPSFFSTSCRKHLFWFYLILTPLFVYSSFSTDCLISYFYSSFSYTLLTTFSPSLSSLFKCIDRLRQLSLFPFYSAISPGCLRQPFWIYRFRFFLSAAILCKLYYHLSAAFHNLHSTSAFIFLRLPLVSICCFTMLSDLSSYSTFGIHTTATSFDFLSKSSNSHTSDYIFSQNFPNLRIRKTS